MSETTITQADTTEEYISMIQYSQQCKLAQFNMGVNITNSYDAGRLTLDDVKHLIVESQMDRNRKPSDATTYRYLAKWREIVESLSNPGNGA